MATPAEQLERIENKQRIDKAKSKAFWMRVTEGIAMVGTAAAVEVVARKALGTNTDPRYTLATSGFLSRITLDGLATALGLLGMLFAKGTMQDVASGMFNAGIVPITHRAVGNALAGT